ncbi:MAG: carboxylating nicotinate-nucleotide diphosphorylase [Rickettsiaceae bacterium H1]|nr:carboxylating nicotinate-nucleotide diphosphorylase [Rickettsiaceae bacterium H1]
MERDIISQAITAALKEDLNKEDITSCAILTDEYVEFAINAREDLILCGIPIIEELFQIYRDEIDYIVNKKDGQQVKTKEVIISGKALAKTLFSIERIALNFIQHLSSIASLTNEFVKKVQETNAIIRDTRKTTPGLRVLEKYAVSIGGGESYRNSLSDKILIKDNHIASCGKVTTAIERIKHKLPSQFIAIECDNITQVKEALAQKVDLILLDNMPTNEIKQAINLRSNNKTKIEASGGIKLHNVEEIAKTGVDYISVGCITNSAQNKDIGLDTLMFKN